MILSKEEHQFLIDLGFEYDEEIEYYYLHNDNPGVGGYSLGFTPEDRITNFELSGITKTNYDINLELINEAVSTYKKLVDYAKSHGLI